MRDIGLFIQKDGRIDLILENEDLKADDGLETAVLISLFSDQRISREELPQGQTNRRGWWGDLFPEVDGDEIGSKLWLLEREKQTQDVKNRFEDYARRAFDWILADGVAKSIEATAAYAAQGALKLDVAITKPNGLAGEFSLIWDAQGLRSN